MFYKSFAAENAVPKPCPGTGGAVHKSTDYEPLQSEQGAFEKCREISYNDIECR